LKWWHAPYKWKFKKSVDQGYVIYKLVFSIEKKTHEDRIAKKERELGEGR
jgi:hypothetical protein